MAGGQRLPRNMKLLSKLDETIDVLLVDPSGHRRWAALVSDKLWDWRVQFPQHEWARYKPCWCVKVLHLGNGHIYYVDAERVVAIKLLNGEVVYR